MGFVRDRWEQYVHRLYDLWGMCAALPVSPNFRLSNTLGLRAESANGGGIQSITYRPSTPLHLANEGGTIHPRPTPDATCCPPHPRVACVGTETQNTHHGHTGGGIGDA